MLAIQFGRSLDEDKRGLILVWAILRLVRERKSHRLEYGAARGHLSRFEPASSKEMSQISRQLQKKESMSSSAASAGKKKKAPPPPPPDAVFIPDDVYGHIREGLLSNDLSTSDNLRDAYQSTEETLTVAWIKFAREEVGREHGVGSSSGVGSSGDWFHWQRTRYCAWWFSTSDNEVRHVSLYRCYVHF